MTDIRDGARYAPTAQAATKVVGPGEFCFAAVHFAAFET